MDKNYRLETYNIKRDGKYQKQHLWLSDKLNRLLLNLDTG